MPEERIIRTCSIWRALEVVGDTSTLLILESAWLGFNRFDEFLNKTGLLKALLSNRLKKLVAAGLLEREAYSRTPLRHRYLLTKKGRDLYWVSLMLLRWEQKYGEPDKHIAIALFHTCSDRPIAPEPACGHCRANIDAFQIAWKEGPGVGWMAPLYSRRRQLRASSEAATTLFEQSAQIMGDRWASLILRSIFTGIRRFDDIQADAAMASNILAERLAWLTEIGVIRQVQYGTGPARFEYHCTRKGIDYYPALLMLMRWGDTYFVAAEGPPLLLEHVNCGHALDPVVVCSNCRKTIAAHDMRFELSGPVDAAGERQRLA